MKNKELVYVISSVRGVPNNERAIILEHVKTLKQEGKQVFDPYKDAPQDDPTGIEIVLSELNYLLQMAKEENNRVDVLWNPTSEGSRVDIGMAIALGLRLYLVKVFNENQTDVPQITLQLLREVCQLQEDDNWPPITTEETSPQLQNLLNDLEEMKTSTDEVIIDWDVKLNSEEAELQRLLLGLALGSMVENPNLGIAMGEIDGFVDPNKKSYPNAIAELKKRKEE